MPIPDSYNGFKFQIRISPTSNIQEESEKVSQTNGTNKFINTSFDIDNGVPLETITSNGRDLQDF
jgi:hypothetical protein